MWLLKTEPSTYGYEDLEREGRTVWDGIRNPAALKNLKGMKQGDSVLIYHTGSEKAAVGLARVVREAYPDPKSRNPRELVVDLAAVERLRVPVSLAEMRSFASFEGSPLLRQGRLSVVPLTAEQWRAVLSHGRSGAGR